MMFYCAILENGDRAYFKERQKAFDYLWNKYLNNLDGDITEEEIKFRREELYKAYYIDGCGYIMFILANLKNKEVDMMFYCVEFEWPDKKFFRGLQHAKDYLWNMYLENYSDDEDDETISRHCKELKEGNFIDGIGFIYPCKFED